MGLGRILCNPVDPALVRGRRGSGLGSTSARFASWLSVPLVAVGVAEEHELTKRAGEALLGDLVGLITKHLKKGERIRIAGLGILQVRKRAARMGRNPATGSFRSLP